MNRPTVLDRSGPGRPSILVVPYADGIGDFVNMLPILGAIQRAKPRGSVAVAASERAGQLLPNESVRVITPSWLRRKTPPRLVRYRWLISQKFVSTLSGLALARELGRFDLTINLFREWEHGMPFSQTWTPRVDGPTDPVHTLDFLAERLTKWGVELPSSERAPSIAVRHPERIQALELFQRERLVGRPVVGLIPTSNMRIKHWTPAGWLQLHRALRDHGYRTVVLAENSQTAEVRALLGAPDPPLLVAQPLSTVAAVLERCSLAVGVDTGLLHMAAAVGTRYVGLFGPTNPAVTGPYASWLGESVVAPFPKGRACDDCWKMFKYENDRCATLASLGCTALIDGDVATRAALRQLDLALSGEVQPAAV